MNRITFPSSGMPCGSMWLQCQQVSFLLTPIVGFGDIVPTTNFGKVFCILSCLFGIFLLSMLVAVVSLYIRLEEDNTEEYKSYYKLIEKDFIYENLHKEIANVMNSVGSLYKLKRENYPNKCQIKKHNLLLSHRLTQFNKMRNNLGFSRIKVEKIIKRFKSDLEIDMVEYTKGSIPVVRIERKLFELANNQVSLENLCLESKYLINRISNLANLMRALNTCGDIRRIENVEGGRLYTIKNIAKHYREFFSQYR
jgi:hypothetical protein